MLDTDRRRLLAEIFSAVYRPVWRCKVVLVSGFVRASDCAKTYGRPAAVSPSLPYIAIGLITLLRFGHLLEESATAKMLHVLQCVSLSVPLALDSINDVHLCE